MIRRISALLALVVLVSPAASCKKKPKLKETNDPRILEARRLMAEAGYPEGKNFPKVELLYNTSESHKKIAAVIQQMWKENLGIEVELVNQDWKSYLENTSKLNYQVARRGWIADYVDPYTFLELMTSHSGNNNTGWGPKEFDELIEASDKETDPAKRMEHLMKAEKLLLDDMPVIPLYFYVSQNMWKPEVKGLHNNILNIHPVKELVKGDGSGVLVMNNHTEVASLDPGISRGVSEHRVQIGLFEGLYNYDPETAKPVPGVAEKYELSDDKKTYTFHLRDCQWSDGRPVTAHDFVYAWRRVADPKTAADYAHIMYLIKGGKEFQQGKGSAEGMAVRAEGDRKLVVELVNPTHYFLDLMPFFTFYPVRKDVIEKHGQDWTKVGNLVGNGPYVLKDHVTNQHILLERNPRYWDAGRVKQHQIKWLPTENHKTAYDMYRSGQCDYLDAIPIEYVDEIKKLPDYHGAPYLGTYYFSFNVTKAPFTDKRVRRALALAIDRVTLCESILRAGQVPALNFVPPFFAERGYTGEPFTK